MHEPQTADGLTAWAVIERCAGQVRAGLGSPYALDFTAILMMADAMGARSGLLADMLPVVEPLIVRAYQTEGDP
ncbi:hypothetical protein [Methylobacterium sp. BTF04]|uniref:DUF7697 family protein n=1 Tax=Methylobacterium sp. BTF04 TaxID=2708300 RepID=UPI0032B1D5AF